MTTNRIHIAILGTRGIPNRYGGFEQCAQHLSEALVQRGHRVTVYNSSLHPYRESTWQGVEIRHCRDMEDSLGTAGQFVYDLNCIRDAAVQPFDVILQLGYTSSSLWFFLWPKKMAHVVNMDGLEYRRSKYNPLVRLYLRMAERLATWRANILIADNIAIQTHLRQRYTSEVRCIAYGAEIPESMDDGHVKSYGLQSRSFDLVIARLEPENHVHWMIDAYQKHPDWPPLVVVGDRSTPLGKSLAQSQRIHYLGAVYDKTVLDALRQHCRFYLHGHSVGGTNPSLLEAMACGTTIVAHDNEFNRGVLGSSAYYFDSPNSLCAMLQSKLPSPEFAMACVENIRQNYQWSSIVDAYEKALRDAVGA